MKPYSKLTKEELKKLKVKRPVRETIRRSESKRNTFGYVPW